MQLIGQTLAHFRITAKLGEGGMGEVYRAEDLRLKRPVALKILPPDVAASTERLERFQREAEAVAALEHPNIVAIHSVEEADGVHFLAMQLVEGRTLSECIPRHGMSREQFFSVAIPLADAIGAAHERGIVHRDLKPANIMIDDEGRVKILDFGLAKLRSRVVPEDDDSGATTESLDSGELICGEKVVGSVAYMSPEQALGEAIDHRSDIFSLAIVLYEMATGVHPFEGRSSLARLSSILKDAPRSPVELKPTLPRHLARILCHGLEKDVRRRYQSVVDLRNDLAELEREIVSGELLATAWDGGEPVGWRRSVRPAVAVAALLGLVLVLGVVFEAPMTRPAVRGPLHTVPLTAFAGSEIDPALSPSGEHLAFAWDGGEKNRFDLYVMLVGGGVPLRLTEGPGDSRHPAWSPDGLEIAFLHDLEPLGQEVVVLPALGGPRRVLGAVSFVGFPGLDWSPDGRWLSLIDRTAPTDSESVFLLSPRSGERRRLTTPPSGGIGDRDPAFSPDGRSLAFVRWYEAPYNEVFVVDVDGGERGGGEPRLLTTHDGWIRGLDWSADGSSIVFSSTWQGMGSVWRVALDGELEQISVGENARGLSVSVKDNRLVYSKAFPDTNLWRVGGPAAPRGEGWSPSSVPREQIVASTREEWGAQFSPDGERIAFTSDRSGRFQIWVCGSRGERPVRLTSDVTATSIHPRWSPDGRAIAFGRETDGNLDVWVMAAEGGFPRRLTDWESADAVSDWSRDGRWIYFFSDHTGTYEVWKVAAEGGEPVRVTYNGGLLPVESADGRFVYFMKQGPQLSIWRVPADGMAVDVESVDRALLEGKEETLVLERRGLSVSGFDVWDDSLVYLLRGLEGGPRFERLDLLSGETETVAELGPGTRIGKFGRISVSADGQWILYPQDDSPGSDLVLVEGL